MPGPREKLLVYRKRHRLSRDADYRAVYAARVKKAGGPLLVFIRPGDRPEHRLGLAVGRRVGGAVVRNRIKRLLREAFRHERAGLPTPDEKSAYDIVVSVRPHAPLPLSAYRSLLVDLVGRCHREYSKRARRRGEGPDDGAT